MVSVCLPSDASRNTYHLTWVSLTLYEGYLLTTAPPGLERGVAPLSFPAPAQPPLLGRGETVADFIFLGSKITADGDCSHEIKRRLLLGRKVMTNLDSILKSRDITLSTKVCLVKAMVFPVVLYGCDIWTIKKAER